MASEENELALESNEVSVEAKKGETSASETIKFTIIAVTGWKMQMERDPSDTVGSLKQEIEEKQQIQSIAQTLVLGRNKLTDDSKTLADCGIKHGVKLRCVVKLMKLITLASMQGRWWLINKNTSIKLKIDIEGNKWSRYASEEGTAINRVRRIECGEDSLHLINESSNNVNKYEPHSVEPGKIKTRLSDERPWCYWCRDKDEHCEWEY